MDVLLKKLTRSKLFCKKNLFITLCSLGLLVPIEANAAITCPDLNVDAICSNGVWQVHIVPQRSPWRFNHETISGTSCNDAQTLKVRWSHAFVTERLNASECGYRFYDNTTKEIGWGNVRGPYFGRPRGSNWEKTSYPGNLECIESQSACVF